MKTLRTFVLGTALVISVSACGDYFGFEDSEPPLPGTRVPVLEANRSISADPDLAGTAVALPAPYQNDSWAQEGGVASHVMSHLALGGVIEEDWSRNLGEGNDTSQRILAQPLVVGGLVIAMDAVGEVSAYNAESGSSLWDIDLTDDEDEDEGYFGGGIAYDGGRVFVTTGFAKVFALDADTGVILWERGVGGPLRAAPTVGGGRVFAITVDNQTVALSAANGERLWSHAGVEETTGLIGAAPAALEGDTLIVPYSSGEIYALSADTGRVLWSDSLSSIRRTDPLTDIAQIRGAPVIDRGIVFVVSHSGRMVAFDLRQGLRAWDAQFGGTQSPWVAGDFVFVINNDQQLLCVQRQDGRVRWVRSLPRYEDEEDLEDPIQWHGPVLGGGRLIVTSSDGTALEISPDNGEVRGEFDLAGGVTEAPIIAGSTLYIVTEGAELAAYR